MIAEIATTRLRLAPLRRADAAEVAAALDDWEICRWLSRVPYPYTRADADWFVAEVEAGRIASHAIRDAASGGFIGVIGIEDEIGYWLARPHWGRGYATEAAAALLDRHFAETAAESVVAGHFEGNAGSARVLAKLGFENTGRDRRLSLAQGREMPHVTLRLDRTRWESRTSEQGLRARQT